MFRHRRQLHRCAVWVLLLWWFGIGAGFANACLAANMAHLSVPAAVQVVALQASDEPTAARAAQPGSQAQPHHSGMGHHEVALKTNCQDFCDKSAFSMPPLKLALDHAAADAPLASTVAGACPVAGLAPISLWLPRRHAGRAPPIRIAFLRLAL